MNRSSQSKIAISSILLVIVLLIQILHLCHVFLLVVAASAIIVAY